MTKIIRNAVQLREAKEELKELKVAKSKILQAQSYTIGGNELIRAKLNDVSEEIAAYEKAIDDYETRGTTKRRTRRVVPL